MNIGSNGRKLSTVQNIRFVAGLLQSGIKKHSKLLKQHLKIEIKTLLRSSEQPIDQGVGQSIQPVRHHGQACRDFRQFEAILLEAGSITLKKLLRHTSAGETRSMV